ncbi:hypothetical protein PLESTB_000587200 [Pleodorina starrii]|uniref:Uncharacterized protein n=1 Tax=Pleodorina starrii TaxID=330485 RepID=A0A9W6F0X5_9CHLO|nr:hypothetical protein PLESTM_000297600 [Pleodorina starrii]GLC52139.1 hypothetical protein PLESTB_000587200 [Pleodorina starrii]
MESTATTRNPQPATHGPQPTAHCDNDNNNNHTAAQGSGAPADRQRSHRARGAPVTGMPPLPDQSQLTALRLPGQSTVAAVLPQQTQQRRINPSTATARREQQQQQQQATPDGTRPQRDVPTHVKQGATRAPHRRRRKLAGSAPGTNTLGLTAAARHRE